MLVAGLSAMLVCAVYFWVTTELPRPERLRANAANGDTRVLDRNGRLLYALPDPLSGSRRPVALAQIPRALQEATIAVEDASFYSNPGVDLRGIARALWDNLRSGELVAGGSTITQQLARNFLLDPELGQQRTFERKIREAIVALKLTSAYSKDEILALYLNQTFYGGTAYGAEAAAWYFFGKPVRELDLAESALLAGLPQAPSAYNPLAGGADAARARQAQVLDAMVRAGFITTEQATAAATEPLQFASEGCREGATCRERAPHFVGFVFDRVAEQLGSEALARGGLTITTTLDSGLQDAAQAILRRQVELLAEPRDGGPDHRVRNGAVIVLDPADGAILAMVGSPDFADRSAQGQVNATLAPRQPGSALKPLTYAAALERGWTPATTLLDIPTSFPTREGRPYKPQNYDRTFHGPLALREALATSSNVSAVRVLHEIGVPALLEMAERLGITTLGRNSEHYGLALTLGGGEVTLLELSAAYGAFASGGQLVEPYAIIQIVDAHGVDRTANQEQEPGMRSTVLTSQVAYLITDILADRYARMRAFGSESVLDIGRPAAAKTGTTSDWRDNWTIGYTPDRVVGVWVGNADGRSMEAISGISGAGPVWRSVMLAAHRGLPVREFVRPDGLEQVLICAEGGMLPGPYCPSTRNELFVAGTAPTRPDDTHIAVQIDPALGCRVPAGYPAARTNTVVVRLLPAEAEPWAISAELPQLPRERCQAIEAPEAPGENNDLPDLPQQPEEQAQPLAPAIVTPVSGAVFAISPGVPHDRQQIEIEARGVRTTASLTIYLDRVALATFEGPPYRAFWKLSPGRHTLMVESRNTDGTIQRSEEIEFVVNE